MKIVNQDSILNGLASDHFCLKDADDVELQQSLYIEASTLQEWLVAVDNTNQPVDLMAASFKNLSHSNRKLFNRLLIKIIDNPSLENVVVLVETLKELLINEVRDDILSKMPQKLAQYKMRQKCSSF